VKTYRVRFKEIRPGKAKKKRTWELRWVVDTKEHSETYVNKEQAKNRLSDLRQAAKSGEAFDTVTGLPDSLVEAEAGRTWFEFAKVYALAYWPDVAANTRDAMSEALATVTPALVKEDAGEGPDPKVLREALRSVAFLPEDRRAEPSPEMAEALRWVERWSLPMAEMVRVDVVKVGLAAVALKMDGSKAATNTYRRKRAVFFNALQFAVDLGEIDENPLTKIKAKRKRGRKKAVKRVDRRTLVNTRQGRELVTAVSYVGRSRGPMMRALFACMYYGALRPEETAGLRDTDCDFLKGDDEEWRGRWGTMNLAQTRPEVGKRWTDSGEVHDERGLKHRDDDDVRPVPASPILVRILREHVAMFGTTSDGRLFRTRSGKPFSYSAINGVLQEARKFAFPPDRLDSLLANNPYSLRHAAVSTQLNAGVSPQNVAERAGQSVEVLFQVYAGCLDGDTERMNKLIEEIFDDD